jgi:hypothetical protein
MRDIGRVAAVSIAVTGPVAHLVERRHGMAEVVGSIPIGSTEAALFERPDHSPPAPAEVVGSIPIGSTEGGARRAWRVSS